MPAGAPSGAAYCALLESGIIVHRCPYFSTRCTIITSAPTQPMHATIQK